MTERRVSIATRDGTADGWFLAGAAAGPLPGVVFFTDGFGLRDATRGMARRLAADGYAVLALNPFYRAAPADAIDYSGLDVLDPGAVARFGELALGATSGDGIVGDIGAAIGFLRGQDGVRGTGLGCVGYCMGGYYSLQAAGRFPGDIAAAASFHGGSLATDSPASPHRLARRMRAEVHVAVAGIDPYLRPGETDRLRGALEGGGVAHTIETYAGAVHGFAVPGGIRYDEAAAERHWRALSHFFGRTLSPPA